MCWAMVKQKQKRKKEKGEEGQLEGHKARCHGGAAARAARNTLSVHPAILRLHYCSGRTCTHTHGSYAR